MAHVTEQAVEEDVEGLKRNKEPSLSSLSNVSLNSLSEKTKNTIAQQESDEESRVKEAEKKKLHRIYTREEMYAIRDSSALCFERIPELPLFVVKPHIREREREKERERDFKEFRERKLKEAPWNSALSRTDSSAKPERRNFFDQFEHEIEDKEAEKPATVGDSSSLPSESLILSPPRKLFPSSQLGSSAVPLSSSTSMPSSSSSSTSSNTTSGSSMPSPKRSNAERMNGAASSRYQSAEKVFLL